MKNVRLPGTRQGVVVIAKFRVTKNNFPWCQPASHSVHQTTPWYLLSETSGGISQHPSPLDDPNEWWQQHVSVGHSNLGGDQIRHTLPTSRRILSTTGRLTECRLTVLTGWAVTTHKESVLSRNNSVVGLGGVSKRTKSSKIRTHRGTLVRDLLGQYSIIRRLLRPIEIDNEWQSIKLGFGQTVSISEGWNWRVGVWKWVSQTDRDKKRIVEYCDCLSLLI